MRFPENSSNRQLPRYSLPRTPHVIQRVTQRQCIRSVKTQDNEPTCDNDLTRHAVADVKRDYAFVFADEHRLRRRYAHLVGWTDDRLLNRKHARR